MRSICAALVSLCVAGLSAEVVIQRYQLKHSDLRMTQVTSRLDNISLVMCCEACKTSDTCRSLSYHGNGSCLLSDFNWSVFTVDATGWNMYARHYGCPDVIGSFTTAGGTRLSVCTTKTLSATMKQSEARAACRQFGNLVKVDTMQKLAEITKLAPTGEYWVDGHRGLDNKTWYFSDKTEIPIQANHIWAANQPSTVGGACVTFNGHNNHALASKECDEKLGYICEIP